MKPYPIEVLKYTSWLKLETLIYKGNQLYTFYRIYLIAEKLSTVEKLEGKQIPWGFPAVCQPAENFFVKFSHKVLQHTPWEQQKVCFPFDCSLVIIFLLLTELLAFYCMPHWPFFCQKWQQEVLLAMNVCGAIRKKQKRLPRVACEYKAVQGRVSFCRQLRTAGCETTK